MIDGSCQLESFPAVLFRASHIITSIINMTSPAEKGILDLLNYLDTSCKSWADFFSNLTHQTAAMVQVMPPHNITIQRNTAKNSYLVKIEGDWFNVDYTGSQAW